MSKTKDVRLIATKRLIKNLSSLGVKTAKNSKRENVAKKTAKLHKSHKSKQSVD